MTYEYTNHNAMSYTIITIRNRSSELKNETVWQQAKIPKHKDIIILRIANEREEMEWRLKHFILAVRC